MVKIKLNKEVKKAIIIVLGFLLFLDILTWIFVIGLFIEGKEREKESLKKYNESAVLEKYESQLMPVYS